MSDLAIAPSRKSVDRPHWWTIGLSLIAICFSAFSLYESHKSRQLNETTSRAVVQTTAIRLLRGWKQPQGTQPFQDFPFEITLFNAGKSLATNIQVHLSYSGAFNLTTEGKSIVSRVISSVAPASKPLVLMGTPAIATDVVGINDLGPNLNASYPTTFNAAALVGPLKVMPLKIQGVGSPPWTLIIDPDAVPPGELAYLLERVS